MATRIAPSAIARLARRRWGDALVVAACLVVAVGITAGLGAKSYDDAFITFRYARNLASGGGFGFDPGEPSLGTTSPLLVLLLAALARVGSVEAIPAIAGWSSGAALLLLALSTYALGRLHAETVGALVAASWILLNPVFVRFWGGESILLLALVATAVLAYCTGRETAAGLLTGLAALCRGEGILVAAVLLGHAVLIRRRFPWRGALGVAAILGPWIAFAGHTFGTPIPSSFGAKLAQGDSGLWGPFLPLSLDWLRSFVVGSPRFPDAQPRLSFLLPTLLAAVGVVGLGARPRLHWAGPVVFVGLYALGYSLLGVPFYPWYALPILFAGILLTAVGAEEARRALGRIPPGRRLAPVLARLALAALLIWPVLAAGRSLWIDRGQPIAPQIRLYEKAGRWLSENTPPGASVGAFEIGVLGFVSGRKFVDPTGLLDSRVAARVARGEFKWVYRHRRPDYLVVNPVRWYGILGSIREEEWFAGSYELAAEIAEEGYFDSPLAIYRRRAPSPGAGPTNPR